MKYYEVWFYYYGEDDDRTDYGKEFSFYFKTEKPMLATQDVIEHLRATFSPSEEFNVDTINCINEKHYPHLSNWFEIDPDNFTASCGIKA